MDYGFVLKCPKETCGYEANYEEWQKYLKSFEKDLYIKDGTFICPNCKGLHDGTNIILKPLNELESGFKGIIYIDDEPSSNEDENAKKSLIKVVYEE